LEIIAKNPNCCFEVDEYMGKISDHYDRRCHLDYDSVLAFGKAKIETHEKRRLDLLQRFGEKYDERYRRSPEEGGKKLNKADCNCVVIKIEKLTGHRERAVNGKTKKTMWEYTF
jgi:nitroimidazol reductase NimA-like FMN-containing flavoprotein (pyridoxamine 5'-phosphate oxidase superfamily)